jgi:hypothetical protein
MINSAGGVTCDHPAEFDHSADLNVTCDSPKIRAENDIQRAILGQN